MSARFPENVRLYDPYFQEKENRHTFTWMLSRIRLFMAYYVNIVLIAIYI